MQNSYRRPSLFWPVLLIGLGVLLLLQNLNLLPAGLWAALAQLWPVLFILAGLDMLLGRRSRGGIAAVLLIGGLLVAVALTWAAVRASQLPAGNAVSLVQTTQEAQRLDVRLDFKAGELRLSGLGPSDHAMEGQVQNGRGESVEQTYAVRGGTGRLLLRQTTNALLLPFLGRRDSAARWEIRLSGELPVTLDVTTGASLTALDLSGLQLSELRLRTGVGQTEVSFPRRGATLAHVTAGVGGTTFTIPADPALPAVNFPSSIVPVNCSSDHAALLSRRNRPAESNSRARKFTVSPGLRICSVGATCTQETAAPAGAPARRPELHTLGPRPE